LRGAQTFSLGNDVKKLARKLALSFVLGLTALTGVWAGLETGTYISDLVTTNPTAADPVSQADDHMRLIKSTVKATFPNVTGAVTPTHTQLNGGRAFSAYQSVSQSIPNATLTKVQFGSEEYDFGNNFDSTTNYRFTPDVAGLYMVCGAVHFLTDVAASRLTIYKNGVEHKRGLQAGGSESVPGAVGCALVSLNGSTDYVELYVYQSSGGAASLEAAAYSTYFQAAYIRPI
jgi:hypothetical protein